MPRGDRASEPQEQGAGCSTASCHPSAPSLGSCIPRSDAEKGVPLFSYSTAAGCWLVPCIWAWPKAALRLAKQGQHYLLPGGWAVRVGQVISEVPGDGRKALVS